MYDLLDNSVSQVYFSKKTKKGIEYFFSEGLICPTEGIPYCVGYNPITGEKGKIQLDESEDYHLVEREEAEREVSKLLNKRKSGKGTGMTLTFQTEAERRNHRNFVKDVFRAPKSDVKMGGRRPGER